MTESELIEEIITAINKRQSKLGFSTNRGLVQNMEWVIRQVCPKVRLNFVLCDSEDCDTGELFWIATFENATRSEERYTAMATNAAVATCLAAVQYWKARRQYGFGQ